LWSRVLAGKRLYLRGRVTYGKVRPYKHASNGVEQRVTSRGKRGLPRKGLPVSERRTSKRKDHKRPLKRLPRKKVIKEPSTRRRRRTSVQKKLPTMRTGSREKRPLTPLGKGGISSGKKTENKGRGPVQSYRTEILPLGVVGEEGVYPSKTLSFQGKHGGRGKKKKGEARRDERE